MASGATRKQNIPLALAGVAWALFAALCWAGNALVLRIGAVRHQSADMQLMWQLLVSAVLLMLAAPFFGALIRDFQPIHAGALLFQIVIVVSLGYSVWFWLLSVYPAAAVASFSFLSPIIGVRFGWLILGESVGATILIPLALVVAGLVLINRPRRGS